MLTLEDASAFARKLSLRTREDFYVVCDLDNLHYDGYDVADNEDLEANYPYADIKCRWFDGIRHNA